MLVADGAAQHGVLHDSVGHADGEARLDQREEGVRNVETRNKCISSIAKC